MNKRNILVILVLIALGTIILTSTGGLRKIEIVSSKGISLPDFSLGSLSIPFFNNSSPTGEAWNTFEKYLEFAKAHDLKGVTSLSHQLSDTCKDSAKETECFALMDSVYTFGSIFNQEDFTNVISDSKQTILYTEGPNRTYLYFTRGEDKKLKVLGMRFCLDDAQISFDCNTVNANKTDADGDGWWDSTESLFK